MPRTKHNNPAHFEPNAHIFDNDMAQITLSDIEAVKIVIQDNGDIEVYDSNGNGYDNPQLLIGDKTHQYIQVHIQRNAISRGWKQAFYFCKTKKKSIRISSVASATR